MTETEKPNPPAVDTAAIRARAAEIGPGYPTSFTWETVVVPLCDALDAAQARADDLAAEVERSQVALRSAEARAAWSARENGTLRMERDRGWERAEAAEKRADDLAAELEQARRRVDRGYARAEEWQSRAEAAEKRATAAEWCKPTGPTQGGTDG